MNINIFDFKFFPESILKNSYPTSIHNITDCLCMISKLPLDNFWSIFKDLCIVFNFCLNLLLSSVSNENYTHIKGAEALKIEPIFDQHFFLWNWPLFTWVRVWVVTIHVSTSEQPSSPILIISQFRKNHWKVHKKRFES